jgi:6-phosphofructokinase 2
MVFGLASGHRLETAFRYGNAAGSAAVLAPGTELCRAEDVKRLYEEVVIHTLGHSGSIAASSTAQGS